MFFDTEIKTVYLINGLARSGNHLFITWLISAFNDNEIYYLNNMKPRIFNLPEGEIDIDTIRNYHTVCSDNKYGLKVDENVRKKLVTQKKMNDFLEGRSDSIGILIFSMENKKVEMFDTVEKLFANTDKFYKCIVIRDILNLFSSRLESEKLLKGGGELYLTDKITIDYWLDNYNNIHKKKYIVFNYNKFVCHKKFRKSLAKKLDIEYEKTKITFNKYGLTYGSSFKRNPTDKSEYFLRWIKNKDDDLIRYLMNDTDIIKKLCKDFSMCLASDSLSIKICDRDIVKL